MRFRPLGKTGLSVSELALGTWGLSGDGYGAVPAEEQDKVIERALALGITLFETADSYAAGGMEARLGERLGASETALFVTKLGTDRNKKPAVKCFETSYLSRAFDESRARLKRDVVDVVLLHNPVLETVTRGEATTFLAELKSAGKIRAWGVSAGSVEVARAAVEKGTDVLSLAFNALFSSDIRALHDDIQKSGTGVLARSVLAHGLLCGYWSVQRAFDANDHRRERWTPDELRRRVQQLSALRPLVGGQIYTMRSAALQVVLANSDVSSILLGPRSTVQLDQLVREGSKGPPYLTDDQAKSLAFRLEHAGVR
jgi:aryl-alcohol dehydrogenase-like predicted oxidoreductase